MKLTIHRGTNQIGGCVTEIDSGGYKIFIDFGEQLPGAEKIELPPIEGLTCGDCSKSALFITHYHGDHIGKICDTVADLPIYIGETALPIYQCLENRLSFIPDPKESEKHKKIVERTKTINTFRLLKKMKVGEMVVTPLLIDHSAFDAYMFIIEAENQRILHTGDFRSHGFRGKGLIPTLSKYAQNIDFLISEGSNIRRPNATMQTEYELQKDFETRFRNHKYNFVYVSSTNIDRLFGLYHAAKEAGRCFVCDKYQADILKVVSKNHKQNTPFYDIDYDQKASPKGRFFVLNRQGDKPFSFEGNLKRYLEDHGFCMLVRSNDAFKPLIEEYGKSICYSMWVGYLKKESPAFNESLSNFLSPFSKEVMHTSGHADLETLQAVFDTVKPKRGIIPIHTDAPERFQVLFKVQAPIIHLHDGEVFDCSVDMLPLLSR